MSHSVTWVDRGREPQCATDPRWPTGIDLDVSEGAEIACTVELPWPAKRCGLYIILCSECGLKAALTTAGRADDPRSLTLACKRGGMDG